MALIGDVIIGARELIPDMVPTLPAPTAAVSVVSATSTLSAGVYYVIVTQRNPWGETLGSTESGPFTIGAGQALLVTSPFLPGATVIRAYLTLANGASGSEIQFFESVSQSFTIAANPTGAGIPPTRSTAWMPDDDGLRMFSAATVYRWLYEGLKRLSLKVGGIQDYSAVGSVSGQPLYIITGEWRKIDNIWYDGFPLGLGNQGGYFRRNRISSSVLASAAVSIHNNQVVIEVFYQPVRTAGSTTLSAPMLVTDTVANLVSLTNFQPFGPPMFVQIGTELIAYSAQSGLQLTGMIRGIGGTTPQAWPAGTTVNELNIPFLGKRIHTSQYQPGNSANVLPLPAGWDNLLVTYLISRARDSEQDTQAAAKYLKDFDDACVDLLRANRQLMGPTQVGLSIYGAETVPGFGTSLGGVVLP